MKNGFSLQANDYGALLLNSSLDDLSEEENKKAKLEMGQAIVAFSQLINFIKHSHPQTVIHNIKYISVGHKIEFHYVKKGRRGLSPSVYMEKSYTTLLELYERIGDDFATLRNI